MRLLKSLIVLFPALLVLCSFDSLFPAVSEGVDLISEPEKRQEIQLILESLTSDPPVETVREQRGRIRGYIDLYSQKISLIQQEITQLGSALEGVSSTENADPASPNSLSGLIALKQQKELELVEARLLLMTAQDAVSQLDRYINSRETRDLLFKSEPLWHLSFWTDAGAAPRQSAADRPAKVHITLLFLSLITLLFFFGIFEAQ